MPKTMADVKDGEHLGSVQPRRDIFNRRRIARFRSFGSRQMRSLLSFFVITTIELIHSVDFSTASMMSSRTMSSSVDLSLSLRATGTRRGAC